MLKRYYKWIAVFFLSISIQLIFPIIASADDWLWPVYDIYQMYRGWYPADNHYGIDISAGLNTPLHATKSGTVIESKFNFYDPLVHRSIIHPVPSGPFHFFSCQCSFSSFILP